MTPSEAQRLHRKMVAFHVMHGTGFGASEAELSAWRAAVADWIDGRTDACPPLSLLGWRCQPTTDYLRNQ